MYHTVDTQTLSPKQISRILNGHPVRVKMGSGAKMHVSTEHAKKLHRASKKGGAATVTLDPYAIEHNQHLRTHVGRIAHKARGGTLLIDEPITARQIVNTSGNFIKNPSKSLGFGFEGPLPSPHRGRGPIKKFNAWTGAIGDFLKPVAKPILEAATQAGVRQINQYGQGSMKGDGFWEDLGSVAKKVGKTAAKKIANEVVQYAGPAAGAAFAAAATASGNPEFAPAAAILGEQLGSQAGEYANRRIQGMGRRKRGGTALIDQPFTTREAVNTTGKFFTNPGATLGFGAKRRKRGGTALIDQPFTVRQAVDTTGRFIQNPSRTMGFGAKRPKRVMSEAQKAALAKGRAALRIKLNEMGAGSGGAARPAGYGVEYC